MSRPASAPLRRTAVPESTSSFFLLRHPDASNSPDMTPESTLDNPKVRSTSSELTSVMAIFPVQRPSRFVSRVKSVRPEKQLVFSPVKTSLPSRTDISAWKLVVDAALLRPEKIKLPWKSKRSSQAGSAKRSSRTSRLNAPVRNVPEINGCSGASEMPKASGFVEKRPSKESGAPKNAPRSWIAPF